MSPRVEAGPRDPAAPLAPDDEAVAAILAAIRAALAPGEGSGSKVPGWRTSSEHPWRFSGRWWSGPVPLRRDRPGR